jgi:DNA-directed RNA polymerase sigma subunit (sigma70/sigma32)
MDLQWELPDLPIDRNKIRQLLQPCIDQLTHRERKALLYRWPWLDHDEGPDERTPQEVADIFSAEQGREVERNAVTQAYFVARSKIKQCLESHGLPTVQSVLENAM